MNLSKRGNRPPRIPEYCIKKMFPDNDYHTTSSDMEEEYRELVRERGIFFSKIWYWGQMLHAIPYFLKNQICWGTTMFKNYLKIALRSLMKHKAYSFGNIAGLAIGLAITIILTFYVFDDLSYDKFHEHRDNIYRVLSIEDSGIPYAVTSGPLLPAAKKLIPEVTHATRITMGNRTEISRVNTAEETSIATTGIFADRDFFNVFNFKILNGQGAEALEVPGNVFLTPEVANALFGKENPLGKPLRLQLLGNQDVHVAGIVEKPPHHSHIQYGLIVSFIPERNPQLLDSWANQFPVGYVLLNEKVNLENVEKKIIKICRDNDFPKTFTPRLQPLQKIHLGSTSIQWDFNIRKNDYVVVYSLGAIGILVLLIACINFINLSTSRASNRAREVGMRKIVGSKRKQIAFQFLGESVLMTVLAFFLSLIFIQIASPFLESILNKQLNLNIIDNLTSFLYFLVFAFFTGILSGIYPAIVLSSFKPIKIVQGEFKTSRRGIWIRGILVVFQFAITTSLIIAIGIIYTQINFLKSRNMGYNRKNVMIISNPIQNDEDTFKQKLSELTGVISSGRITTLPNDNFGHIDIKPEGTNREDGYMPVLMGINHDLFDMLGIPIVQGRNFAEEFTADAPNNENPSVNVIVNEELVRIAGWDDPIGKRINFEYTWNNINKCNIVGVVKDFHYGSSKQKIEPTIFLLNQRAPNLMVRLYPDRINETVKRIEKLFATLYPEQTFNHTFLDDLFERQFNTDQEFAGNITLFSGIAIFIACFGLIGLVSYTVVQRQKEVALRKILGCNKTRLVSLLTSNFLKLIVIANLFAWPCVYFVMQIWMNGFAYQASFTPIPYLLGCIGSLAIAIATTLFQTVKAARANPVETLRAS